MADRDHPSPGPFADAERDVVRQLRGRLAAGVTLWTAGAAGDAAGLTVSSLMVANGTPARVLGLLDPLSDLVDLLGRTQKLAVTLLRRDEHYLAEVFAGRAPSPGGRFTQAEFVQTAWGRCWPVSAAGPGCAWNPPWRSAGHRSSPARSSTSMSSTRPFR